MDAPCDKVFVREFFQTKVTTGWSWLVDGAPWAVFLRARIAVPLLSLVLPPSLFPPGMLGVLSALSAKNKEKVLTPFAHTVFCHVPFV